MAAIKGVWGIDIGQCALKAVKLRPAPDEGKVELLAFDVIDHAKILSQPDADRTELIRASLEKFASRNDIKGDKFVIGVPGHQTFAKFCPLPPVEQKKIPEIVKFEAGQQIPFAMEDVVWDYEVFQAEDSPDVEVGIFAMRRDLIRGHLDAFDEIRVVPAAIQTIPLGLYNFYRHEAADQLEEGEARVIVDVGAQHTNLVLIERNSAWTRNIPLGGNNFTEALIKGFKLSFSKAENLKRSAATSKYARQIFKEMRPVFADLVAEIQRSLGYYTSTHREVELKQVIACGNAFLLPGLQKYLENNLTISGGVQKLEKFERLVESAETQAPDFTGNILTFGASYGLALQGLGMARIDSNLLPPELARIAAWKKKQVWFAAAAACTAVAALMPWARIQMDSSALAGQDQQQVLGEARRVVTQAQQMQSKYNEVASGGQAEQAQIDKLFALSRHRALLPKIIAFVHASLPPVDERFEAAETPEARKQVLQSDPGRLARTKRKQFFIDAFDVEYVSDIDSYERPANLSNDLASGGITPGGAGGGRFAGGGGGGGGFDPGGGRFGGGGGAGGGRFGGAPPSNPYGGTANPYAGSGDAGAGGAGAGFYVRIAGRITYGGDQMPNVAALVYSEYYPRLLELGRQAGLGFWVPEEDPRGPQGKNLPENIQFNQPFNVPTTPYPAQPGQGEADSGVKDPVTGEDISRDWTFSLGFKIKLGEPPAAPEGENANPTGG